VGLREEIDLAVLDVSMPRLTGLQAARRLLAHRPELKVLILSMHDNEQFFFEALQAGAGGYVLKTAADDDLVAACRAVMRGEPFLYPAAETEVVKLIAEGYTSKEIGETLSISDKTVERHRARVLDKLGLRDRVALTLYAVRRGLVEP
jgi:DNA-binding NarL/FixJ family response regulator